MITDILFDFFGTLVSYTAGAFHTAPYERTHAYLLAHGFELPYDDFVATFSAVADELEAAARVSHDEYDMDEVGRRFFRAAWGSAVPDALLKPFIALFIAEWSCGIVYLAGLDGFLSSLATRYRLSIVSNTHYPPLIHENLAAMGVARHFAQIVTSVELGRRKPDPAIFRHALAGLGVGPERAIYVGDTYVDDYQGASGAGLRCVLIDPDGRYPDVPERVATLFELAPLLPRLERGS